jgi:hypothetical protein
MKTLKQIREENLNEKKAEYLSLQVKGRGDAKRVWQWLEKNYSHVNTPYDGPYVSDLNVEFENVKDADKLMADLKKAGFKFTVDAREGKKTQEVTGDKEAYQKFFKSMLKKFGVTEPDQLKGADRKKFYDAIDAGWEGDNEED